MDERRRSEPDRKCSEPGCDQPRRSRGLCNRHYKRARRPLPASQADFRDLPGERWLPIPGYEGYYEVSDHGRVRSLDRTVIDKNGRSYELRGAIMKTPLNNQGRPNLNLWRNRECRLMRVHTLVLMAFVGPRPPGMEACHYDGDPANNHLSNLRWDTRSGNRYDAVRHGTHPMTAKVTCKRGHRLERPNLVEHCADRHRTCLACTRAATNSLRAVGPFDVQAMADRYYLEIMAGTDRERMAFRTHCPRGHPLEAPNLVPSALKRGARSCWACARAASRMHTARRSGKTIDFKRVADEVFADIMAAGEI